VSFEYEARDLATKLYTQVLLPEDVTSLNTTVLDVLVFDYELEERAIGVRTPAHAKGFFF
jgi:hypothetical protein